MTFGIQFVFTLAMFTFTNRIYSQHLSFSSSQVSWEEFYSMVTGGKKAPASLGMEARGGAAAGKSSAPPPPTGQNVVQARNAKKTALEEFAKENNLKPESIKKAYKRFQVSVLCCLPVMYWDV